jgi:hypothetical protein
MPFAGEMSGWWWLNWRIYDTRIRLAGLDSVLGRDATKARRWLSVAQHAELAVHRDRRLLASHRPELLRHELCKYLVDGGPPTPRPRSVAI